MKTISLGNSYYIPVDRILHIFPYKNATGQKIVAAAKAANQHGTRIYDCSGKRSKVSIVVIQGGLDGDHIVLSPLTARTISKKISAGD